MKNLHLFPYQIRVAVKPLVVMAVLLALFLALNLASSQAAGQGTGSSHTTFLPLVMHNSGGASDGAYARMLQKVEELCAATGINQVCYVNGQVTLQPKNGIVPFDQPGDIADLANVQSLNLSTIGADNAQWSIAWLRLRADAATPDQELTILTYGNVQISDITLLTGAINPAEEATLPALRFASSPVSGVDKLGTSGLIVTNPADDELLSLTLNGAAVTLGSTALVEAQPGDRMTISMAAGTSLTDLDGEGSIAVQNHRVHVPLNQAGEAAGAPSAAEPLSDADWLAQHLDDLFKRLVDAQALANAILARLNRSVDRCIGGRAASVYNVLYWVRVIETTPQVKFLIGETRLNQAYSRVPNCLSFELDFDSSVTTTMAVAYEASHLRVDGMPIQFLVDGRYIAINTSLDYLSYVYTLSQSCGPITTEITSGMAELAAGSLSIAGNRVRISTTLRVLNQPTDKATLHCPPAPPVVISHGHWVPVFYHVHQDLLQSDLASFLFREWKYTANMAQCDNAAASSQSCPHFGEAIYQRSLAEGPLTMDTTTFLVLVHTPEQ